MRYCMWVLGVVYLH